MPRLFSLRARLTALAIAATLVVTVAPPVLAQATGSVRGRVTDAATNRPLNGAQVFIPGSSQGTITGANGDFLLLNVPAGTATIRAEMLGYTAAEQTVTITSGAVAQASFTLQMAVIALDEVVVTGTAGATQKRAIGNAVSTIQAAQVTEVAPVSNVSQLLQARSPGLTIMQPSGTVGTAANIRIRGTASLNAGNHPVFYVDGVRINSSTQGGFGVGGQSLSALDALNPDDIESIEVIKGPAAATLYGADAGAGVIQIITKKGKTGQQAIQWTAKVERGETDWGLEMPTNYTLCTAARTTSATYPGCEGQEAGTIIGDRPLERALRTGERMNYTLNARGGGERFSFYVAGDRAEEDGIFVNNSFVRNTGRANFFVSPKDNLDLTTNISYSRSDTRLPLNDNASNGWLRNAFRGYAGRMGPFAEGWRGLGPEEMSIYDNQTRSERFIIGTTVNYEPISWFRNRLTAGLDAGTRLSTLFYPIDRTGKKPYGNDQAQGYIDQYSPETRNWTLDYVGTINTRLNDELTSDISFGVQYNAYRFESLQARGIGLFSNDVRLVSTANETFAFESFSETRSLGFFAQEQLGWKNRLFVTGALRMDNSSVFGNKIERIFYPKLSASYVISDEPFFNVPMIDQLRLRAAWGQAGNAPDPFSADRTYEAGTVILDDGVYGSVLRADAFGNSDLKAERGSEVELGFEASLLEQRAGIEVTYYNNTTNDALIQVPVVPSSGFTGTVLRNVGTVNNQGLEVSVFGTPVQTSDVVWDTRLALSTNSNELVSFGGALEDPIAQGYRSSQFVAEGYPMGAYWAPRIVRDENGDPVLDEATGRPVLTEEDHYFGPSAPTREASWTNTVTLLKNLRLYTFMDYKGGHLMFNMTAATRDSDGNSREAVEYEAGMNDDFLLRRYGGNSPYYEKADFVKLREVSLTYDVPSDWLGRVGVEGMSLSVAGRNLAIWTKYDGMDPEVNIAGASTFTRADYMSVPMLRQIVTTVNVRF